MNEEGKFIVKGKIFDKVYLTCNIEVIKKLLKPLVDMETLRLYNNISCQSFVRLYVKLNKPIEYEFKGIYVSNSPFQKIIEMNRKKCIYMISYSDNKFAEYWTKVKDIEKTVENLIKEIFKQNVTVLKHRLEYWPCGTHYFRPLPKEFKNRSSFLKKVQNPISGIHITNEGFSRNQGWCEGSLESVLKVVEME